MTDLEKARREEIAELIRRMTLEEKVSQLLHTSMAVDRLGIPAYNWWNEALHGVGRAGAATVFPQTIGLAATFNTELAQKEYDAISTEARAKYNEAQKLNDNGQYRGLTFWTPNINIVHDPRWGRAQETFGEDPYLTSEMGVAAVKGLQGDDPENMKVAACAKHFAVHSGPEATRHTYNAEPTKKDLWETYLPAFKALVDAGVESVMGAYQRLYGEPCCGSKYLLVDILRNKWNFKGHVVSDCWAVQDFHQNHKVTSNPAESAALAINNTCDLNCGCTYHAALDAVRQGLLTEKKIDESLERLLMTRFKLGMFDTPSESKWAELGRKDIDSKEHRALARKVAQESIVLLKNKNNLLPLKKESKNIMVMGPTADSGKILLGNYYGLNSRLVSIIEGLVGGTEKHPEFNIDYTPGCSMYAPAKQRGWTLGMAESADVVIACFGLDGMMEGEEGEAIETLRGDRERIELPESQIEYLRAIHDRGTPVVLVLTGGASIAFPEDVADAVLMAWYPGEEGGNAIADIIFGDAVPSGHLPVTFYKSTEDLGEFEDYHMKGKTYRFLEKEPLFPFGFGLSYGKFCFMKDVDVSLCGSDGDVKSTLTMTADDLESGKILCVDVKVANSADVDADCVAQLYVSKVSRGEDDPLCSLRRFTKIALKANETKTVHFELKASDFYSVDEDGESKLEKGEYSILLSDSSPCSRSVELGGAEPAVVNLKVE